MLHVGAVGLRKFGSAAVKLRGLESALQVRIDLQLSYGNARTVFFFLFLVFILMVSYFSPEFTPVY